MFSLNAARSNFGRFKPIKSCFRGMWLSQISTFAHSFVHSFVRSFVCSFVRSFVVFFFHGTGRGSTDGRLLIVGPTKGGKSRRKIAVGICPTRFAVRERLGLGPNTASSHSASLQKVVRQSHVEASRLAACPAQCQCARV